MIDDLKTAVRLRAATQPTSAGLELVFSQEA
jgi:hypothetical protein